MAYDSKRFTENAAGMTGRAAVALYDGTGTDDQGGDPIATIRADNFFTGQEVKDACREAQKSEVPGVDIAIAQGGGLLCIVKARDTTSVETLYLDSTDDEVKTIGQTTPAFRFDGT